MPGSHVPRNAAKTHIAIIGGGSAAFAAAIRAAEAGARVTLIEGDELGGTCVNVGCVPSKMLLRAAEIRHHATAPDFDGLPRSEAAVDRPALLGVLRSQVEALQASKYVRILKDNPAIDRIRGHATFLDARTLTVDGADGERQRVSADRVLVATGSRPAVPSVPGLEETPFWTSTEALFADAAPEHLAVIGASFVAVEIAQAFSRLGSRVTVLARGSLLGRADPVLGADLQAALESEGIRILAGTTAHRVDYTPGRFSVTTADGEVTANRLLVAAGRTPNTAGLGLGGVDVATDAGGAIRVDRHLRTSHPDIFAAGDCTDLPKLVYVGAAAGSRAAVNMTGGNAELDVSVLPQVVFTDPQAAWVGLDEAGARRAGLAVETRRVELGDVPRARVNLDTRGFVQLVAEQGTGRLVGAQILAHDAGETIQTAAMAIRAGMSVDDIAGELFPYLTMAEGLKLCAQAFSRDISQLSCCAG